MFKSEVRKDGSVLVTIEVEAGPDQAKALLDVYLSSVKFDPKEEAAKQMAQQGKSKLDTVKLLKEMFDIGLKESKDIADKYYPPFQ